jgi:hypothetical protein
MKRSIAWLMGLIAAGSLLGGCVALVGPVPVVPGPRIVVAPAPVVVAPRPWGWWGYHGHGWQRRAYR